MVKFVLEKGSIKLKNSLKNSRIIKCYKCIDINPYELYSYNTKIKCINNKNENIKYIQCNKYINNLQITKINVNDNENIILNLINKTSEILRLNILDDLIEIIVYNDNTNNTNNTNIIYSKIKQNIIINTESKVEEKTESKVEEKTESKIQKFIDNIEKTESKVEEK